MSGIEIDPGNYSSTRLSGSVNRSPSQTTTYTLKATNGGLTTEDSETVTVSAPMPTETCFTTPQSLAAFSFELVHNGLYYYDMDLSSVSAFNADPITKITNRSSKRIALYTGGEVVILRINETTTIFNGYSVARGWTVESESPITPRIEFCTEN